MREKNTSAYSKYIDNDYYIMVTNSTERILSFEITFNDLENIDCNEGKLWKDTLSPGEGEKIKVFKQKESFKAPRCGYIISYKFS